MNIRFNEYVRKINIDECIIWVNCFSKEYIALYKELAYIIEDSCINDYTDFNAWLDYIIEKISRENQDRTIDLQVKTTLYYLVDNHFLDTDETVLFDSIFHETSQSFVDVSFVTIPQNIGFDDLKMIVNKEIEPFLFCDTITYFKEDDSNIELLSELSMLGNNLQVCFSEIAGFMKYISSDFFRSCAKNNATLVVFPEQYDEFKQLMINYEFHHEVKEQLLIAPIIDWKNIANTKEFYVMLLFMGFNVLFCSETLFPGYSWSINANYKDLFELYYSIIEFCDAYKIPESKLINMRSWPLKKYSENSTRNDKYHKGVVYYTTNNSDSHFFKKNEKHPNCCKECCICGFCNAPKNLQGSCSILRDFIIFKLIHWDDEWTSKVNLSNFMSERK